VGSSIGCAIGAVSALTIAGAPRQAAAAADKTNVSRKWKDPQFIKLFALSSFKEIGGGGFFLLVPIMTIYKHKMFMCMK
jgi:hypothetical protein